MWNIIQIKTLRHPTYIKSYVKCIDTPLSKLCCFQLRQGFKTAIQPLVDLQNKAVKFVKTFDKATLDEIYVKNHIPTINNSFKMSAGMFMHSYENN